MDIEFLIWLQNIREASGNIFTPFIAWFSHAAFTWFLVIPFIVYWCINKSDGLFLIVSVGISRFFNGIIKVGACVYRPYVRDPRIIPFGKKPTGYSFPSGHTMWTAPIFGGLACLCWKKTKLFAVLCAVIIIFVAFTRNYLGVHTPQDVIAGTLAGLFSVWIAHVIMSKPEHENSCLVIGILACIAGVAYTMMKTYPMDYADGKLLVDPEKMMLDTFYAVGMMTGLITGRYAEREYINFEVTGLNIRGIILAVIGLVPVYFIVFTFSGDYEFIYEVLEVFTVKGGRFVMGFILMFWTVALWPMVIKLTGERK